MNSVKQQINFKRSVFHSSIALHALASACFLLGACSADPVNLGDGRLGVDRSALSSYAAVWEGYVEALEFSPGSDRVRLVLDENGTGTVTFGAGEPLPQPTDPDNAFPFERFTDPSGYHRGAPTPVEGFAYSVSGALVEDERLRAATLGSQVFEAACAIQTPVAVTPQQPPSALGAGGAAAIPATSGPQFACLPSSGYSEGPPGTCYAGDGPISCSKAALCASACECTETACSARAGSELRLDAALNDAGDRLEGTLLGLDGSDRVTVRLTRSTAP